MATERRTILYSGMVQGVGFRWTTVNSLRDLPVQGYVRNLPDGRVELVLEAESAVAEEATRRVRDALERYICAEEARIEAPSGEFAGFGVRR